MSKQEHFVFSFNPLKNLKTESKCNTCHNCHIPISIYLSLPHRSYFQPSHGADGNLIAGLRCEPGAEVSGVFLAEAIGQLEDHNAAALQRSARQKQGVQI